MSRLMHDRRISLEKTSKVLSTAGIVHSFLSVKMQIYISSLLTSNGNILHDCFIKKEHDTIEEAITSIKPIDGFSLGPVVFMPYRNDEGVAFIARADSMLDLLTKRPFLISVDGFILLSPTGLSGAIVDYYENDPLGPAEVTLLGQAAQQSF